jgi:hypothetical protein
MNVIGQLKNIPDIKIIQKKNRSPFGSKRFDYYIKAPHAKAVPLIRGVGIEWARIRISEIVAQKGQGLVTWLPAKRS